jgi:hypothetical protein
MSDNTVTSPNPGLPKLTASIEYIFDENTKDNEELAALIKPVKKRFKYTIYYNALLIAGFYKYGQNINKVMKRYFKNRMRGVMNMILFATFHSLFFSLLLIGGNCMVLGINPISFIRKHREITERIIEKEGLDVDSLSDIFKIPLKKIEESKLNGKTFQDELDENKKKASDKKIEQEIKKL